MAVAYGSTNVAGRATGSSFTSASITVSGTNPVLVLCIGMESATATVSSVGTFSAGSSAAVEVKTQRSASGNTAYASVWAIPAPSAGAGTVAVTLSASVPYQYGIVLMTGADQTTPCPLADAVGSGASGVTPHTLTASNLTANDGAVAMGANTVADDAAAVAGGGTALVTNTTTNVNFSDGYKLGTGSLTVNWANTGLLGDHASISVRVAEAAAAGGSVVPVLMRQYRQRRN